eukprot:2159385-Prymnesium_polylepis.1
MITSGQVPSRTGTSATSLNTTGDAPVGLGAVTGWRTSTRLGLNGVLMLADASDGSMGLGVLAPARSRAEGGRCQLGV